MGKFKFKILLQGIDAQIIMNLTESDSMNVYDVWELPHRMCVNLIPSSHRKGQGELGASV